MTTDDRSDEEGPQASDARPDARPGTDDLPQVFRIFDTREKPHPGNHSLASMSVEPGLLFEQAMEQTRMAIALTDPHAPDNPLVMVNRAFETMTGYGRRECIGRNCRFLQTERTSKSELDCLRIAMAREETVVVELENRRKDGSVFMNALHVGPIYDAEGRLTHFYGSQWNISELVEKRAELVERRAVAREMQHRLGNLFTVVSSIVRLSGRGETDVKTALAKANERILALSRAHQVTIDGPGADGDAASLHDLVETIVAPYRLNTPGRIVLGGNPVEVPPRAVTPIGLTLHELATNAVKYGALRQEGGRVCIEWDATDRLVLTWEEEGTEPIARLDGGPGGKGGGTGTRILQGVMTGIGANISFHWRERGVKVTIAMPLDDTPERT